jgi:serine/threonine protein kinase
MKTIREIDRGGFGVVEEVELADGTRVARKTFDPQIPLTSAERAKLETRFKREVVVQSELDSESFVSVLDSDMSSPNPWYRMPLADRNFQTQIDDDIANGLVPHAALSDILNSLEELHRLGFVHRDLKPQNVLLLNGKWKLTDFGLVRPPSSGTTQLTSTGSNWGTELYCAPEQSVAFKSATLSTDIYAFGCILHDIFVRTPRVPYSRHSGPGPIGTIIEKCTEQRPERRFKSIQVLRGALLTHLAAATMGAASPQASEWANELGAISTWDQGRLHEFCRYVCESDNSSDLFAVFSLFDEDMMKVLVSVDEDLWKAIVLRYCEWLESTSFAFDYCDVLVPRLRQIFELGDYECKSRAALAAAELARSHNRWYVMRSVVRMCGPNIEDSLAQRIAIEISAMDANSNFVRCVEGISQTVESYHPKITKILS